ncbi:hypothetical protein COMA2_180110 [Candidatus Nitrospira nitrificans]|uniref:Uncharacterized protein n=1 Tax=Candidatus Nitrospira nitrificans TaxID=1742973 RepID=A0A0S4LDS5_9BACT|nr:hypothetical protein COMA2_180110 [Candidatus Nitrospira nitrificans]
MLFLDSEYVHSTILCIESNVLSHSDLIYLPGLASARHTGRVYRPARVRFTRGILALRGLLNSC